MKWLKIIDVTGQAAVAFITLLIWSKYSFAIFYFGLGTWQALSCLLHLTIYNHNERNRSRQNYERILTLVIVLAAVFGMIAYIGLYIPLFLLAAIMLFGGVIMAIWYFVNCLGEIKDLFDNAADEIHTAHTYTN